jgi:hypothetical protein
MANGARFTVSFTMADGFTNAPKSSDDFDAVSRSLDTDPLAGRRLSPNLDLPNWVFTVP